VSLLANLKAAVRAGLAMKKESAVSPSRVAVAIRNRFNPIRDLKPENLALQLDQFHNGVVGPAARMWDAMERRDVYLRNVISKRKKSVARLSWEILTKDDSEEAKQQAKALEQFYKSIRATSVLKQDEQGGLSLLIRQMCDAIGKEFAVHEIVWAPRPDGLSAEFRFCPLWWFENKTGKLRFLPQEFATDGEEMAEGEWLVTVGEGLMECSSVAYVFKHMPLKDWLSFSEKFGLPGVLGKTNAPKDSPEWTAMEEAVGNLMNDWAAVASANDVIELIETKGGAGHLPFPPLVEYCDRAIAAVWRGADLSTIAKDGNAVGASLQGDESNLLLEDDAEVISETLNERVTRYALQIIYGPDVEPLAFLKLQGRASEAELKFKRDVFTNFQKDGTVGDIMANLTDLKELVSEVGIPVNNEYQDPWVPVETKNGALVTGETVTDPEGDVIGAVPEAGQADSNGDAVERVPTDGKEQTLGNEALAERSRPLAARAVPPTEQFLNRANKHFSQATREAFRPVAQRLQRIFAMSNELEMRVELNQLLADWPQLKEIVTKEPKNAKALEEAISAALLNGLSQKTKG
jgi:phage gp29-like protein